MNRQIALCLVMFASGCADTVIQQEPDFVPTGGSAFENFFGGRTEIALTESGVPNAARKLHLSAGIAPTASGEGTFTLIPNGPIDGTTPTSATCTITTSDGTSYGASSGTVVIHAIVDHASADFGKLDVHIDATVTNENDPGSEIHVRGDAIVPIDSIT